MKTETARSFPKTNHTMAYLELWAPLFAKNSKVKVTVN